MSKPDKPMERCAKCGSTIRMALGHPVCEGCNNHRDFCVCFAPAPVADGGEILSVPDFAVIAFDGTSELTYTRLLAHDAALRARADAAERALFQMQEAAKAQTTRADRLAEALREIAESCCYLDTDYKAIAAAALKREGEK